MIGLKRALAYSLMIAVAASPSAQPSHAQAPAKSSLERLVRGQARDGFSGTVVVAQGDRVLLAKAVGKIKGVPVRLDSRYWISSTGKQFVSAAIFKLQDEGRLSVDDPLQRWLPDVPPDKRAITLRQLLTHTSGLPQGYVGEGARDNSAAVEGILALKLEAEPGARFIYSNENFYLAAAIVERIAQQSYRQYLRSAFTEPLAMANTGVAKGQSEILPTKEPTPKRLLEAHWGISGHYSSAPDLVRWYRALASGAVIRTATVRDMWKPTIKIGEGEAAAGWFVTTTERGSKRIWTRGNDDYGANSLIYAYPDRDLVIVILTHAGDKPGGTSWSRALVTQFEQMLEI